MFKNITDYQAFTPEQQAEYGLWLQSLTPEQQAEHKRQQIEQLDRELSQSWEQSNDRIAALSAPRDPLREKSERELEKDILTAVRDSRFSQASLAQIARYNSIPIDVVESIAQQIAADYMGRDLERLEFESISQQIQKIEANEQDPGIRDWKLGRLAKRHGSNRRSLMECYNKSLCSASLVKAKPIGEFLKEHLTDDVKYLVGGWLPQGIMLMIHGEGGTGKTLLIYDLMSAILKGEAWSGYPCQQAAVLLVQVDEPETITAERIDIRGISSAMPLKVMSDWQVEQMTALESEAAKMPRNSLIVIDSITAINRNCYFSENDTEYARPILQIRDIARKFGHTVILIHHSNSEGNPRGTKAIYNSVDVVWGLSKAEQFDRLLRIQKMRRGMPEGRYKLAFDDETFRFTYRGEEFESDEDFEQARTHSEKIRLWLCHDAQRGRKFEPIEVSEALGISKPSTRRLLRDLATTGAIEGERKPGTPYYLYFVKKKQESDRAIGSDRLKAISDEPVPAKDQKPSDRAISIFDEKITEKNDENHDRPIASTPLPQQDRGVDPVLQSDRTGDLSAAQTDRPIASCNTPLQEKVEVGDTVLVTGEAIWCRSGSDKLPWKEVPPSQRSTSQIPINVLGEPIFHELMEGGKVIEVKGNRVKVRNPKTGRTSVFAAADVRILRGNS